MSQSSTLSGAPPVVADSDPAPDTQKFVPLEGYGRFSDSLLWELQRKYFANRGPAAWSTGEVPSYITSNPRLAEACARLAYAALESAAGELDRTAPVYIVELGAGSGKFSDSFMRAFFDILDRSALRDLPVRYVMTDFADANVDAHRSHPQLGEFARQGRLDFARFDAERDTELRLLTSGERLAADTVRNPLLVFALYVFDGLVHDLYYVADQNLYETHVRACVPAELSAGDDPARLIADSMLEFRYLQAHTPYPEAEFNEILSDYRVSYQRTHIFFPTAPLRCLERLYVLANQKLLILVGDRGVWHAADLEGQGPPAITAHGSFSLPVNQHAIGAFVTHRGGRVWTPRARRNSLALGLYTFGWPIDARVEEVYTDCFLRFSPEDFFHLKKALDGRFDQLSLTQLCSYLRLSEYDPQVLRGMCPTLLERADQADVAERHDLRDAILRSCDNVFHLGEAEDLPFRVGMILYGLGFPGDAVRSFTQSLELYGPDASAYYNLAACHLILGQTAETIAVLDRALELTPDWPDARELRERALASGQNTQ